MQRLFTAVLLIGLTSIACVMASHTTLAQTNGEGSAGALGSNHTLHWVDLTLHWITRLIEFGGISVIVIGALAATFNYLRERIGGGPAEPAYHQFRLSLGRSILLGLEFLVAADIIMTVAIEPTLRSVAVLGGIVLVRTFLSFALEVEMDGQWPWQRSRRPQS